MSTPSSGDSFLQALDAEMKSLYADVVADLQREMPWLGPVTPTTPVPRWRRRLRRIRDRVAETWSVARHGLPDCDCW